MRKLSAAERNDRVALRLVAGPGTCVRHMVTKATDKATLARLVRSGHVARDTASEYSDALALTWDGQDYLAVLEESWHD
jgi:poly(A) polymerase Pap1